MPHVTVAGSMPTNRTWLDRSFLSGSSEFQVVE
jgi:hypothetical protein